MAVDSVSRWIALSLKPTRSAPERVRVLNTDYLMGLGTLDERRPILVNIDKLMTSSEIGLVTQTLQ